ncbi:MAG: DUF4129 domain-containing protein [Sphingopyxis sp.]|nr:DUF4129 domain-containing protein [Sphingopyxis sp.]
MTVKAPIPGKAAPSPAGPARAEADAAALADPWLADADLVDPAYAETMASEGLQTSLPPPEPVTPPPRWLLDFFDGVGNFFGSIFDFFELTGPGIKYALWAIGIALLLFIAYRLFPGFADWVDRLRGKAAEEELPEYGQVEASAARARLADADALAAEGRFAEAVHLLLYRSVGDIAARRPGLVKPAITSRDLAASRDLPGTPRTAFARIARAVEVSLFGGQPVDAGVWGECRAAYAELTVPRAWAAA